MKTNRIKSLTSLLITCLLATQAIAASTITEDYKSATIFGYTTSGIYDASEDYKLGKYCEGNAKLKPLKPTPITTKKGDNFFDVLTAAFPTATTKWEFEIATTTLSNNCFAVHTYDVIGTPSKVGCAFHVEYIPHGTDPTTNIHWIQVINDNHNITDNEGHGNPENIVDAPFTTASPYYDDGGAADGTNFYDFPWRADGNKAHYWQADLYLVSGPAPSAPGKVTIYSGIRWGWTNSVTCVPAPGAMTMAIIGLSGIISCRRRFKG